MARIQPAAISNLPEQAVAAVAAEAVAEIVQTVLAPATKNCARCGTTNTGDATACMVCKHTHFRASKPAPQRFGKTKASGIFG